MVFLGLLQLITQLPLVAVVRLQVSLEGHREVTLFFLLSLQLAAVVVAAVPVSQIMVGMAVLEVAAQERTERVEAQLLAGQGFQGKEMLVAVMVDFLRLHTREAAAAERVRRVGML